METNTTQKLSLNTAEEIRAAVEAGNRVFVGNRSYEVIKDCIGQWLILCHFNSRCIGLTWRDNVTLNCKPSELFVG